MALTECTLVIWGFMNSQLKIILCLSFFFVVESSQGSDTERMDKNGNLYTATIELSNPSKNQKVLLVGMIHIGPKDFYSAIASKIENWMQTYPKKTMLAYEFFACGTSVLDANRRATKEDVEKFIHSEINFTPSEFITLKQPSLENILKPIAAAKALCVLDVDGKTKRPPYLVERNKAWCETANQNQSSCQWQDLKFQDNPLLTINSGDIDIATAPAGLQLIGLQMYRTLGFMSSSDPAVSKFYNVVNYVMLPYRNLVITNNIFKALNSGYEQVVVPWGDAHLLGIRKILMDAGFVQTKIDDVLYMTREDSGKWSELDDIYYNPLLDEKYIFDE